MAKNENEEQEEERFGCSVVLTLECVLNFTGSKKLIADRLKFLYNSAQFTECEEKDEEDYHLKFVPVIISEERDTSNGRIFSLRNWKYEMEKGF